MLKHISILSLVALAVACAHEEIAQPADKDWEHGLDAELGTQIAPLGPIDSDQGAYNLIRRREKEHALGSRLTALELDDVVNNSSQVLASALALPLFKAGVYYGQPRLIDKGCAAAQRVTNSALRSSGSIDAVVQACGALTNPTRQGEGSCSDGQKKLRDAYALLAQDKGPEAGRTAAEAVRFLRDRCPKMAAPLRTPVDPSSRGFLIVWVLHANDAPPTTFLAGETSIATAEAINEGFLRGVQAVRPLTAAAPRQ
jgi:hypothetical protein